MTDHEKGRLAGLKEAAAMARLVSKKYAREVEEAIKVRDYQTSSMHRAAHAVAGEINQAILALGTPGHVLTAEHREMVDEIRG